MAERLISCGTGTDRTIEAPVGRITVSVAGEVASVAVVEELVKEVVEVDIS